MHIASSKPLDIETPMRLFAKQTGITLSEDDFLLADAPAIKEPFWFDRFPIQSQIAESHVSLSEARSPRSVCYPRFVLACFPLPMAMALIAPIRVVAILTIVVVVIMWFVIEASRERAAAIEPRLKYATDTRQLQLLNATETIELDHVEYFLVTASLTQSAYRQLSTRGSDRFRQHDPDGRTEWHVVVRDGDSVRRVVIASADRPGGESSATFATDVIRDVFSLKKVAEVMGVPVVVVRFELLQQRFFVRLFSDAPTAALPPSFHKA